ncbi:MAG: OsmC family protein [Acidobacteria bacterium]|nr:OsmC family protein [Acidobacteriota bacterium]
MAGKRRANDGGGIVSTPDPGSQKKSPAEHGRFTVHMEQVRDFEFRVKFDKEEFAELRMDEPAPLGSDSAPNASRILAAAVGNCLSASLLFCLRKSHAEVRSIRTDVQVELSRNEQGKLRIGRIAVAIEPEMAAADAAKLERCRELFEDFCVVTQSVRQGIDVRVQVRAGK